MSSDNPQIIKLIADSLQLSEKQIRNAIRLLDEGATIPFMSRYRKEMTDGMDEVQLADTREQYDKLCELLKRRETVQIEEQTREITVSIKSKERSEAQAQAENARALMVEAQEKVQTIRDTEIATRQKAIELIEAQREAEAEGAKVRILAEAEKAAAQDRADADRITVSALEERLRVEYSEHQQRVLAEALRDTAAMLNSDLAQDRILDQILIQMERVIPSSSSNVMLVEAGKARVFR